MWRPARLLLFLMIALTACGTSPDSTPPPTQRTNATVPVDVALPTTAPTPEEPAPDPTPDPRVWDAIANAQDVGVPLPKSARLFGGGIYVPADSAADIQTAQFSDSVLLGVNAYFPNAFDGDEPVLLPDGENIASVSFFIFDPNGNTAYEGRDDSPPYCLFGESDGTCDALDFAENGCLWEGSELPATAGFHQLNVNIAGADGQEEVWFATLDLQFSDGSPCGG